MGQIMRYWSQCWWARRKDCTNNRQCVLEHWKKTTRRRKMDQMARGLCGTSLCTRRRQTRRYRCFRWVLGSVMDSVLTNLICDIYPKMLQASCVVLHTVQWLIGKTFAAHDSYPTLFDCSTDRYTYLPTTRSMYKPQYSIFTISFWRSTVDSKPSLARNWAQNATNLWELSYWSQYTKTNLSSF